MDVSLTEVSEQVKEVFGQNIDILSQNKLILSTQEHIETDMAYDRSRIENLEVRISSVETQMRILLERIPRVETKMKDAVAEATAPLSDQMDQLMVKAKENTIIEKAKRGFLARIFKRKDGLSPKERGKIKS